MYADEACFEQSGTLYRHWAERGVGQEVKSFPTRKKAKVIGAVVVGVRPKWHFKWADRFNGKTFLRFLKRLARHYTGRKIYLILDNAKWLEANPDKMELHFLPPYSPELNPVELVWKETKKKTTHNRYFPSLAALKERLFRRFNRFQGNPASLRNLIASFV
ncbi:MAG: IS630 family transposase [Desulfomonilaceae bacterium]